MKRSRDDDLNEKKDDEEQQTNAVTCHTCKSDISHARRIIQANIYKTNWYCSQDCVNISRKKCYLEEIGKTFTVEELDIEKKRFPELFFKEFLDHARVEDEICNRFVDICREYEDNVLNEANPVIASKYLKRAKFRLENCCIEDESYLPSEDEEAN